MHQRLGFLTRSVGVALALVATHLVAHGAALPPIPPPSSLAVRARLPAPPRGVADLKFGEMFTLPIGPQGLEPSARLRELDGQRVRLIGYMVYGEAPTSRSFLLSPLPVTAGDEDESLADDIPASAMLVRVGDGKPAPLPHLAGLIRLTGVLHVGTTSDDDSGRNVAASLDLDAVCMRALRRAAASTSRRSGIDG